MRISFILTLLFFTGIASSYGQSKEQVVDAYDYFLEYEFVEPDAAFTQLQSGLNLAVQLQDKKLIAEGFKYMSWHYQDKDETEKAIVQIDSCIRYADKLSDKTELINAYNQKGNLLSDISLLDSSLIWYDKGLILAKKHGDEAGIAKICNNMALVYVDKGDYLEAIDLYHESIKVSESIGDVQSVADAYNNLGTLFAQIEDYKQALEYHQKAYQIRKDIDDPFKISSVTLNIGRIYLAEEQYDSARAYFFKSLGIDLEMEDNDGVALNYNNIGLSHFLEGELDSAIHYYRISLNIRIEIEDPWGMALSYNNIGEYYNEIGQPVRAIENCTKAYQITLEKELPYERIAACECLQKAYETKKDFGNAFKYLKETITLNEQLYSEDKNREMTKKEMQFVFHYQALEDSLKNAEIIKTAEIENEKIAAEKKSQLWLFSVIGFFLILIGGIIYIQLRRQKIKNELIEKQKAFIQDQKHEIDQSIAYAQKIQDTALPSKALNQLFEAAFLIYLPRDVVSGDFYWLEDDERYTYFSVADCTGHGIPGAFISMMGTILLNEIYNSKQLKTPGAILDELNRLVQLTLMSRTGEQMKDGMDIAFCRYDKQTALLEFAGANNPLWIISQAAVLSVNGENMEPTMQGAANLFEVKAQKQPIGKYAEEGRSFQTHHIQLQAGDQLYVFSDGYADQFGGENGKKFKYKPFKQLLLDTAMLSATDQKAAITQAFYDWKGEFEQIDDVCIIGVRV